MNNLTVSPILDFAITKDASDIHISESSFIYLRIDWKLIPLESTWKLDKIKVNQILLELLNEQKDLIKEFVSEKTLDFSYISPKWNTFRINAFYKLWKVSLILRMIDSKIKTFDELMVPDWVRNIINMKSWLILVGWPAWSWKSTTITSILDTINTNRSEHIITMENPVEFVFENKKSVFSQKNIWRDTKNMVSWLISCFREDANIVYIWEIKNKDELNIALDMVESWMLVIWWINSSSTSDIIKKLYWFYNNDEQLSIQNRLSDNLWMTIFQKLVNKSEWKWRVAVFEIMKVNDNVKLLLKSWKTNELANVINVWMKDWMISLNKYAWSLVEKWLITNEFKEEHFPVTN